MNHSARNHSSSHFSQTSGIGDSGIGDDSFDRNERDVVDQREPTSILQDDSRDKAPSVATYDSPHSSHGSFAQYSSEGHSSYSGREGFGEESSTAATHESLTPEEEVCALKSCLFCVDDTA